MCMHGNSVAKQLGYDYFPMKPDHFFVGRETDAIIQNGIAIQENT